MSKIFEFKQPIEEEFDKLIEKLRPEYEAYMEREFELNESRLKQFCFAISALGRAVEGAEVEINFGVDETAGYAEIESKKVVITDTKWFSRASEFADTFDMYPLLNGKTRISFSFENLYVPTNDGRE